MSQHPATDWRGLDYHRDLVLAEGGVVLRPWALGDAERVIPAVVDPLIWTYTTEALTTPEAVSAYVARALAERAAGQRYSFAVSLAGEATIIGSSSLGALSAKDRRIEIGWTWLARPYQGLGINTAVKYLLLRYCFETIGAHRVEFKTDRANPQSCAALAKIGATAEGVLRSHTLMHDGRYRDTAYYSILEQDWPAVAEALRQRLAP